MVIPTTAGTGSEMTKFTIIADTKNNVKMLIGDPYIMPTISVSDPMFTISVPPKTTAATGIDAFAMQSNHILLKSSTFHRYNSTFCNKTYFGKLTGSLV